MTNPKILIAYLRLLKERQLVFPDEGYSTVLELVGDSIDDLGWEGPPEVFAIVDKIVKKIGRNKMISFDVLIWNDDANGMIEETDTRFEDSQSEHADEDWVWFWSEVTHEWINKKKSEDVESDSESEEPAKSDSEDVESDSEEALDFSYKGA